MKKIMIALAAIAMAFAANAAAAPWKATLTNIYLGDATTKYAGTVYIMDAATYSMEALYNNFANNSWTATELGSAAAGSIAAATGNAINKAFDYGNGGSNYDFYAVVLNGNNIYFSQLLENKAASTSTAATSLQFGTQATGSQKAPVAGFQGASAWSSYGAVPEPTSGILLLMGLAGLALRRKRA